jgi:pimeloyl-ACP methyl ester carboxylesterase
LFITRPYALTRAEIAPDKIVLFGYSLGGFLVARAAAFEHRVAALILDDGIYDFHAAFVGNLPPFLQSWIDEGRDDVAVPVLAMLTAVSTQVRWGLRNGMWVFGADSFADLIRKVRAYTLDGIAHQIVAPTLILDPEHDQYLKGQPQLVEKALTGAPTTLVTLTDNEGAGEHTHAGGLSRAHQTMFDWLDATLTASSEDGVVEFAAASGRAG